jgi:hypothetical protein
MGNFSGTYTMDKEWAFFEREESEFFCPPGDGQPICRAGTLNASAEELHT